jgi:hypothetical protein
MYDYIEKISQKAISNVIEAIRQYREGQFKDVRNLPGAIITILEYDIDKKEFQEFAIAHYSQIVNIIFDERPQYLAIKKDLKGRMHFQVDSEIVEPYL